MTFETTPSMGFVSDALDVGSVLRAPTTKPMSVTDIVNARRVIDGPSDKLRAVSATKYPWVRPLWAKMRGNRWEVEQVQMVRDKLEFTQLPARSQMAVKRATAFLSNLDAIQTENLSENVTHIITDPTISQLIARQVFEEWIHVEMYSAIIETLFNDPLEIYDMYRHVPELGKKNDFITAQGAVVTSVPTSENKAKAFVSNIALEGIYFFSGFVTFFAINRATGKLNGVVDGIKYIQRDELTHLEIFSNSFNTLRIERPELFTKQFIKECQGILIQAAELEIGWGHYVIDGGIPGMNNEFVTNYIQRRAEECAQSIGIGGIFPKAPPAPQWVLDYSKINGTQGNFFESKPTTYTENKPTFGGRSVKRI